MSAESFTDLRAVRDSLDKSQSEFARLLGISTRAVQSYEQGWRPVPPYVQRMIGMLLFLSWRKEGNRPAPCWKIRDCPPEQRDACPTFELGAGDLCWLLHGSPCKEEAARLRADGIAGCSSCPVVGQWLRA
jgi:hypothetical protein